MKTVPLKVTQITLPDGTLTMLDYRQYLFITMRQPKDPRAGVDIAEMEHSLRVLNVLKDAGETLTLEDADFEYMVSKLKAAKFNIVDQAFIDFVHDLSTPM